MHGYIDSFPVPMHLPASATAPPQSSKGKGKGKEQQGASKPDSYDVVASWTAQERDEMERKVSMASRREFCAV